MELETESKKRCDIKHAPSLTMEINYLFLSFMRATKISPENRNLVRPIRLDNMQKVITKISEMDLYEFSYEDLIEMGIDPNEWWVCYYKKGNRRVHSSNKRKNGCKSRKDS